MQKLVDNLGREVEYWRYKTMNIDLLEYITTVVKYKQVHGLQTPKIIIFTLLYCHFTSVNRFIHNIDTVKLNVI